MPYYLTQNWFPTQQYPQLYPSTHNYIMNTTDLVINVPGGTIYGVTVFADLLPSSVQYRRQGVDYSFPVDFQLENGYVPVTQSVYAFHWPLLESNVEAIRISYYSSKPRIYSVIVHIPITSTNFQLIPLRADSISIEEYRGIDKFQNLLHIIDQDEDSYATITFSSGIPDPYITLRFDFSPNLFPHRGFFLVTPYVKFQIPSPPSGATVTSWMQWGNPNIQPQPGSLSRTSPPSQFSLLLSKVVYSNLLVTNYGSTQVKMPTNSDFSSFSVAIRPSPVIYGSYASLFASNPFTYAPFISAGIAYSRIAAFFPSSSSYATINAATNMFALFPTWTTCRSSNPAYTLRVYFRFWMSIPTSPWELRIHDAGFLVAPVIVSKWQTAFSISSGFFALPYNPYLMDVTRDDNDSTETEDISPSEIIFIAFPFGINPQNHSIQVRARSTSGSPSNVLVTKYAVEGSEGNEYFATYTETIQIPPTLSTANISFPTSAGVITYPYVTIQPR